MTDRAHDQTDGILAGMEKHLSAIYARAGREVSQKAEEYFRDFSVLDRKKQKLMKSGKISQEEYLRWRRTKILYGRRYKALKDQLAGELANVNETALKYINGELPEIYALNYSSLEDQTGPIEGYSFTLVDRDTVKSLSADDPELLPLKYLDRRKDLGWNKQKINAEVLQGILQGESMGQIARRMAKVAGMDQVSAIRNARTMVTAAENKGRLDSYIKAEADGILLEKEWLSSNQPGRTRHWHMPEDFDKLIVPIDEPFHNSKGDIMYPGDPAADPSNVYN